VCKASIAAVVLALGIVSLVQEGTNAMVALAGRFATSLNNAGCRNGRTT